jgi:hypothetical protein
MPRPDVGFNTKEPAFGMHQDKVQTIDETIVTMRDIDAIRDRKPQRAMRGNCLGGYGPKAP